MMHHRPELFRDGQRLCPVDIGEERRIVDRPVPIDHVRQRLAKETVGRRCRLGGVPRHIASQAEHQGTRQLHVAGARPAPPEMVQIVSFQSQRGSLVGVYRDIEICRTPAGAKPGDITGERFAASQVGVTNE